MKHTKNHKTGYYVWIFGEGFWHRTLNGAKKRAIDAQNYCHNVQIISCETGKLICGHRE